MEDDREGTGNDRDTATESVSRIDTALDEIRDGLRKAMEELDARIDAALAEIRPRAQAALREVGPGVNEFIADVQPRLDALLQRIQVRINELRQDLEQRAARTREPGRPIGEIGPADEDESGKDDAG